MVHEVGDIFLHLSSLISSELSLNFPLSPPRDTQTEPQSTSLPHVPDSSLDIVSGEHHIYTTETTTRRQPHDGNHTTFITPLSLTPSTSMLSN